MRPTTTTGHLPSVDARPRLNQHVQLTHSPDPVDQDYLMSDARQQSFRDGDDGDSDLEESPRNSNNILAMKSQHADDEDHGGEEAEEDGDEEDEEESDPPMPRQWRKKKPMKRRSRATKSSQDANDEVDSDVSEASGLAGDEDDGIFEDFADKKSVSADLRRPKAGFGYNGRLGFTGEYAKEVANVYEEKREYYEEKVKEMNEEGRVAYLGNHGVHTVLLVIPTKIPARALNSAGYRAAYYKLILDSGRSLEAFQTMCDASDLHQQASKLLSVPKTFEGTAGRDKLRTLVSSAILAIINAKTPNGMEQFQKLPRHRLQSILTARNLKWRAPKHWSAELGGTQERIYDTILSTRQEKIKITYNAVKGEPKESKLVRL
ncbi:hypothetical protein BDD12DRAFT_806561 [Trichophaea hybrida]|nr:hypothetical protein BDD12DRAFT_806561 [Trichophaea hybrida]